MDCKNINLKRGCKGEKVTELQQILKNKQLYTGKIDGNYGVYTENAVKTYQTQNKLLPDGIYGEITCTHLTGQKNNNNSFITGDTTGVYKSIGHFIHAGCDKLGQCTSTYCAPHSIHQATAKCDLEKYADEYTLAAWAGTTNSGTSHNGIETALYQLSRKSGIHIHVQWKNLSDMGATLTEQMKAIGKIIEQKNKQIIWHLHYRNKYGHYEVVKEVNLNNQTILVLNSLGQKCGQKSYCGYQETRTFKTQQNYCKGISQPSLCIITIGE